ncbi:MAG: GMC family oxidoreductase N-terminal domain-containing protein, partial [Chrysiogenetes bacterium]|nr:GMC family oxidoreductase N-terminal domain-containing protein [Chrysiogenetes bacterium]
MSIHQGKDITGDLTLETDVCIVGSGASGAVAAERLSAAGKKVLILEEGGYHTAEEFNMREMQMMELLYQDKGARATKDLSIMVLQGRAVGGGTVINGTICYRTPEQTVERWIEDHGVKVTHEELVPHWKRIEERLNIKKIPIEAVNKNNRVLWDGAKKLGWQVDTTLRNVKNCAHLGYCFMACPADAKQAMHITMIPDAMDNGADLYADVRVDTIETDGRKVSTLRGSVLDRDTHQPNGKKITVKANWVVLAGGAINTPALLLRSGVGNANGRVGKRTFLQPVTAALSEFEDPIMLYYGSTATMGSHEWAYWGADRKGFFM